MSVRGHVERCEVFVSDGCLYGGCRCGRPRTALATTGAGFANHDRRQGQTGGPPGPTMRMGFRTFAAPGNARSRMRRKFLPAIVTALCMSTAAPAWASGDSCEPGWSLDFAEMPGCDNIPVLVPGNDTRANLLMLLADRHAAKPSVAPVDRPTLDWLAFRNRFDGAPDEPAQSAYANGEGSRCLSNDAGEKAFAEAVAAAAGLSPDERRSLSEARTGLRPSCSGDAAATVAVPATTGELAGEFAGYLRAATAFYAGRFDEAGTAFGRLESSRDPWLSEASAYMRARNGLNRLQVDAFDEYGTFKGPSAIEQDAARRVDADLLAFVARYPGGRYAASAQGLRRRVAWLAGWTDELLSRYATLIAEPAGSRSVSDADLADEIDNKILPGLRPGSTRDPSLLATLDLLALRREPKGKPQPERPDIASQADALSGNPDLHGYLQAVSAYYADNDPRTAIRLIPDDARRRGGGHLWFSRQFLRGLSLEAVGDRNARGFWKELIPSATRPMDRATAELALALNVERRGDIGDAFVAGSPLTNEAIRSMLLIHDAGPDLLRARTIAADAPPRQRRIALYTLLRKELSHGSYAEFLADLRAVPGDAPAEGSVSIDPVGDGQIPLGLFTRGETKGEIGCPDLAASASALAEDPAASRPLLCLAEWMRLNEVGPDRLSPPPQKGALGAGPSAYPGKDLPRSGIYSRVIADRGAPAADRAYALYRAVKCYEPSGYNACGGPDAPKAERQHWHETLKHEHPGTRWARELRYWW